MILPVWENARAVLLDIITRGVNSNLNCLFFLANKVKLVAVCGRINCRVIH
ncbi:hypothetical protein RintRC_7002 [Richelia intracellularis]|nr:hypothetical protein RintRC_7002 [Richelia intracellularis]